MDKLQPSRSNTPSQNYLLSLSEIYNLSKLPKKSISEFLGININDIFLYPKLARKFFEKFGADFSFKVISHVNLRGGCGKTTATISLATRAKSYGHKVCILDLDQQATSTKTFKVSINNKKIFSEIYKTPKDILEKSLIEIEDGLFILPSSDSNSTLDTEFGSKPDLMKSAVKTICDELKNLGFTLVIIDNSPSLSTGVVSAICASNLVVIPICADNASMDGLESTIKHIYRMCDTFGIKPPNIKILFTKYDKRDQISENTYNFLKENALYSKLLLPNFIRVSVLFERFVKLGKTVFADAEKSNPKEDYDTYTKSILGFSQINYQGDRHYESR